MLKLSGHLRNPSQTSPVAFSNSHRASAQQCLRQHHGVSMVLACSSSCSCSNTTLQCWLVKVPLVRHIHVDKSSTQMDTEGSPSWSVVFSHRSLCLEQSSTSCHIRTVSDCIPKSLEDLSLQSLFLVTFTTSLYCLLSNCSFVLFARVAPNFDFGKSEIRPFFPNPAKFGSGHWISGWIWPDLANARLASATAVCSVNYG